MIRYTCERCQKTKDEKTEPLGHTQGKAVYENVNLATCQAEGSRDKVIYCTVCKAELSRTAEILPKTDHDRTLVGEKKATCMGGGYTGDVVCSMCGEIFETGTATDPVDHSYTAKKTTARYLKKAADYDSPAEYYYACVYCGERVRLAMRMAQSSRVRAYRQQRLHLTRQNIHMMVIRRSRL